MRRSWVLGLAGIGAISLAGPSAAKDSDPCPANLVCASKPNTITDIIKTIEPTAKLSKNDDGEIEIKITGRAYDYFIFFKDCEKGAECAALTFSADFTTDKAITPAFVNKWNKTQRIGKAYLDDDGALYIEQEISTVGGISKENFRDWKSWWDDALSNFADFYDAETAKEPSPAPDKKKI